MVEGPAGPKGSVKGDASVSVISSFGRESFGFLDNTLYIHCSIP